MANIEASDALADESNSKKGSKLVLILSLVLCLAGAGLGYFVISSGLLPIGHAPVQDLTHGKRIADRPDVVFVPIPPLLITLPPDAKNNHLRFTGEIEVPSEFKDDVEFLMPRIQDLMNGYLRALKAEDIEGPGALFRIRLQLFRRIVMVVGLGKANGLLVTEFILN